MVKKIGFFLVYLWEGNHYTPNINEAQSSLKFTLTITTNNECDLPKTTQICTPPPPPFPHTHTNQVPQTTTHRQQLSLYHLPH